MKTLRNIAGRSGHRLWSALLGAKTTDAVRLPSQSAAAPAEAGFPTVKPRTYRTRLTVLLAAITVPAMAAPGGFGALPGAAPTEAEIVNARLSAQLAQNPAMPFERPGMSFPGSAFFFLADPGSSALVALPSTDATDTGAESGRELGAIIDTGPAARPFYSVSGISHLRASECLAQAVWYEAASESEAGQRAVAQVVLNRVAHRSWPGSVCGVVYEGSQRSTGCQFSFTCDGSLARRAGGSTWARAQRIAGEALSGSVYAPIGHATHYHTLWVNPYWASSLDHIGTIGAHRFYRNRGAGGEQSAFNGFYSGFEPGPAGRTAPALSSQAGLAGTLGTYGANSDAPGLSPTNPQATPSPSDDAANGRRLATAGRNGANAALRATPEPILADPALSSAGQVRDNYARAGQWRSDAAREALQSNRRSGQPQNQQAKPPEARVVVQPVLPTTAPATARAISDSSTPAQQ